MLFSQEVQEQQKKIKLNSIKKKQNKEQKKNIQINLTKISFVFFDEFNFFFCNSSSISQQQQLPKRKLQRSKYSISFDQIQFNFNISF